MATVEDFESALKEVVNGKRLSASKMGKLTDLSMKLMEHDTQLVSILYRTHKSLPASSKISSLYCFDALCRAARAYASKHKLAGDIHAEKGNAASFLLKTEGILDGLFQDMHTSGIPETKDKTKKILDIWTKSSTFPADVLARLSAIGRQAETPKEITQPSTSMSDPRKQPTPLAVATRPATSTTPTAESAQAALLALLSSATATGNAQPNQIGTNITPPIAASLSVPAQPQLDPMQSALLQHLVKIAGNGTASAQAHAGLSTAPTGPFSPTYPTSTSAQPYSSFHGQSSRSPPNVAFERTDDLPRQTRFDNASDTGRGHERDREPMYNQRQSGYRRDASPREGDYHAHEGPRGGNRFSGRGRGRDYGPPRWSSADKRQNSRSRSPPQYGRQYSPSVRSPVDRPKGMSLSGPDSTKDEFGRDIRQTSEEPEQSSRPTDPRRPAGYKHPKPAPKDHMPNDSQYMHNAAEDVPAQQLSPSTIASKPGGGLETFDMTTFDPTNADSWQTLGDAYQRTNGYMPAQEELMEYVMSSMSYMMSMGVGMGSDSAQMSAIPTGQEDANASSIGAQDWGADTYGGGTQGQTVPMEITGQADTSQRNFEPVNQENEDVNESNKSGGRMQKIGDRWVFVRDGAKVR